MRILHTSDWHLGKKIEGRDRLAEQQQALQEICGIANAENVEAVLVCGDIYDTFTPSAAAEDLFYGAVAELSAGGRRLVAVIAGNHDDPTRLSAAAPIAGRQAIIISGGGDVITGFKSPAFSLIDSGEGYITVQSDLGERAVLNMLAYPSEARLKENRSDTPYSQKIAGYLAPGNSKFSADTVNITLTHLFAAGAFSVGDEREIEVGGLKICSAEAFSPLNNYVALGHIHRSQQIGDRLFYSGSLLPYSVDDSCQKGVYVCDLAPGKAALPRFIPLSSGRAVMRVAANSVAEAAEKAGKTDAYVYLTLVQDKPIESSEYRYIKNAFPNVVYINLEIKGAAASFFAAGRKNLSKTELFTSYYKSIYNSAPDQKLTELFIELID